MITDGWLWIPISVWAAFAQTMRNAAQRQLTGELGTLGARLWFASSTACLSRRYGCTACMRLASSSFPRPTSAFGAGLGWAPSVRLRQQRCFLRVMAERNFTLGVAYSKSEIIQVAIFGFLFLGDLITQITALAVICATVGVLLLSPADKERPIRALLLRLDGKTGTPRPASGTGFAFCGRLPRRGAGARAHTLSMAAAYALVCAQILQRPCCSAAGCSCARPT